MHSQSLGTSRVCLSTEDTMLRLTGLRKMIFPTSSQKQHKKLDTSPKLLPLSDRFVYLFTLVHWTRNIAVWIHWFLIWPTVIYPCKKKKKHSNLHHCNSYIIPTTVEMVLNYLLHKHTVCPYARPLFSTASCAFWNQVELTWFALIYYCAG